MNRELLNFYTKDLSENSVKKATYIVREYLRYSKVISEGNVNTLGSEEGCAVSLDEFLHAVKILLAHSHNTCDKTTEVEFFRCENDCRYNNGCNAFCDGEYSLGTEKKLQLCKHYSDSWDV